MKRIIERQGYKNTLTLTLNEAFQSFLNAKSAEGVRERTIHDYHQHWKYFTEFLLLKHPKVKNVDDLSADLIREYINYQRFEHVQYAENDNRKKHPKGLSAVTINIRIRTLKAMCRFWYMEHILSENIGCNIHQLRYDDDKKRTFTDDEIVRLLDVFNLRNYNDWRDYILIRFLVSCGARINETCNIHPEDVLFDRNSVYLSPYAVKSRHGREVPLDRSVMKDLHDLITENKRYFGNPEYVFLTTVGKRYNPSAFRHRLRQAAEKAGIERATPHMLRHYFITQYAKRGDLFTLQRIVDHKNIQTTRGYVDNSQEEIQEAHNKFSPLKKIEKLENKRR
jgi:integrase/recombinase XerD